MDFPKLRELDIDSSFADIENYFERFELWCSLQVKTEGEIQVKQLLMVMGSKAYGLVKTLLAPRRPAESSYEEIRDEILEHLRPSSFEIAQRATFNMLTQEPGQRIKDFVLALKTKATKCDFGGQLENNLRDRFIAGVTVPEMKIQLFQMKNSNFKTAVELCVQLENAFQLVSSPANVLTSSRGPPSRVHGFKKYAKAIVCECCGKNHHRNVCRFKKATCFKCGKPGHIKTVCRASALSVETTGEVENRTPTDDEEGAVVLAMESVHIRRDIWTATGNVHCFILDTGSVESLIPFSELQKFHPEAVIRKTSIGIKGVTGHVMSSKGETTIPLINEEGMIVQCKFLVTERGLSILGLRALKQMQITICLSGAPIETKEIAEALVICSKAKGGMNIPPVRLEVSGGPVFLGRRVLPYGMIDSVKRVLDELEEQGILIAVEASQWATPIVTPLKRDGVTPRICGDYRITLNKHLLQRACTTLEIEDVLNKLKGAKWFSKIDLQNAFLQIPLDDESSKLTTINTPWGLFRYRFLPFGLSVSPAIFQQKMDEMLRGLAGVTAYQDGIIVYAPDKKTHDERLESLLKKLREYNVKINLKKCEIEVRKIDCLGLLVDSEGVHPHPNRLKPLVEASSPMDLPQLRSWLGALQYYSKFIPNFASSADVLFKLATAEKFEWKSEPEECLRKLLSFMEQKAKLQPFARNSPIRLITDASKRGLGADLERTEARRVGKECMSWYRAGTWAGQ